MTSALKAVKVGDEDLFPHRARRRHRSQSLRPRSRCAGETGELNKVVGALVRVFIANGNRGDRKQARLKHLLEKWTLEQYLEETEKAAGLQAAARCRIDPAQMVISGPERSALACRGIYPQSRRAELHRGGHSRRADDAQANDASGGDRRLYGSGEIRLTVWQNFIIPNVTGCALWRR